MSLLKKIVGGGGAFGLLRNPLSAIGVPDPVGDAFGKYVNKPKTDNSVPTIAPDDIAGFIASKQNKPNTPIPMLTHPTRDLSMMPQAPQLPPMNSWGQNGNFNLGWSPQQGQAQQMPVAPGGGLPVGDGLDPHQRLLQGLLGSQFGGMQGGLLSPYMSQATGHTAARVDPMELQRMMQARSGY